MASLLLKQACCNWATALKLRVLPCACEYHMICICFPVSCRTLKFCVSSWSKISIFFVMFVVLLTNDVLLTVLPVVLLTNDGLVDYAPNGTPYWWWSCWLCSQWHCLLMMVLLIALPVDSILMMVLLIVLPVVLPTNDGLVDSAPSGTPY